MSIHKLTAGSGYDYLTRQVAALDGTDKGHTTLATYYTERGETPGSWAGSGLSGIDGLTAGDVVTAEQMRSLFGSGHHPLADSRSSRLPADATVAEHHEAVRLGASFKIYDGAASPFQVEVAARVRALASHTGVPDNNNGEEGRRAEVRTQVAREWFVRTYDREPIDPRELSALIARETQPKTTAVAGFDLTFSPVKSVSTLWALADETTAAQVERAHREAVSQALKFVEDHALFTRLGTNGVRQVDVTGLVATTFTHRDSRAGDPDLHTHVAVSNKVRTLDGRWRAVDGRTLYAATVSASEVYNTAIERSLAQLLGLRFAERTDRDPAKRPIREVVGVDPALNRAFSKRRVTVQHRRAQLVAAFQDTHGRPPTPIETIHLAQQATLETRDAKHAPRTLSEQRRAWHSEAVGVLGSADAVRRMMATCRPRGRTKPARDAGVVDVDLTARRTLTAVEQSRATWTTWHVYAEAQRQVRSVASAAHLTNDEVMTHANAVTAAVLDQHSVRISRLTADDADIRDQPTAVRRSDGTSAYVAAGSTRYTSQAILAAERRLVAAAGRLGAPVVPPTHLDAALIQFRRAGGRLNDGQEALVRAMATSGLRLQLAIAPAGSGKTTAMEALAATWRADGGSVLGLAPSAAAAGALCASLTPTGHATDPAPGSVDTDTLAKLVHTMTTGSRRPAWFDLVDEATLVVIDEAGMADTLTLDAAVRFLAGRGATVRLIGDDQQLTAIGAGGVLRDIKSAHGALHLDELVRFADPAEGSASLALREGRPEALGFYLDNERVHVGDISTVTADVFDAWRADRAAGLDALMVAPTRALVADLNHRAREARVARGPKADPGEAGNGTVLADGNQAGVGDTVITRTNDRRLRAGPSDWVKNGDRWLVKALVPARDGSRLVVQHLSHGCTATLPPDYVLASTGLGYACTIHAAQGVTADTVHGVATGSESRQQLYTMLTRGRRENHVHLVTVGDLDNHDILKPEVTHPRTAVDVLETVLARDDAAESATSAQRHQADPAARLGPAANRYLDSLHLAAEHTLSVRLGPDALGRLDHVAESLEPGLIQEPAWPTLRSHLALIGLAGTNPGSLLRQAVRASDLDGARDRAAVVDWRLTGLAATPPSGPLPWLPAVPSAVLDDPDWGGYLRDLENLVISLASQVRDCTRDSEEVPPWVGNGPTPSLDLLADLAVWRAATHVEPDDQRPTGAVQHSPASARWQRTLDNRLGATTSAATTEWHHVLGRLAPQVARDPFAPLLAHRLSAAARTELPAHRLLLDAAAVAPLPDDHAAAALWWRMARHLTPAVATHLSAQGDLRRDWEPQLFDLVGEHRASDIRASRWWPALVVNVQRGLERGWRLDDLTGAAKLPDDHDADDCELLVWRSSIALDPIPVGSGDELPPDTVQQDPPEDLHLAVTPPSGGPAREDTDVDTAPQVVLTRAAILRDAARLAGPDQQPTDRDIRQMYQRQEEWDRCPVTRERLLEVNGLAQAFFEDGLKASWGPAYLVERLGADITGDPRFRVGYAPDGWTTLLDRLRDCGVSDDEFLASGIATLTRNNRVIDRFRDRLMFPIAHPERPQEILGFVGRRNPTNGRDTSAGPHPPKYLNTPTTPLFHKGDQLYGAPHLETDSGASPTPVLVEGPIDAVAVTLASAGRFIGISPMGTALTDAQARQLATRCPASDVSPVIATDADHAGEAAAERAFWLLSAHGLDPTVALLPIGSDPASTLSDQGPAKLTAALTTATALGDALAEKAIQGAEPDVEHALAVLAARPSCCWDDGLTRVAQATLVPVDQLRAGLARTVVQWDAHTGLAPDFLTSQTPQKHVFHSSDRGAGEDEPRMSKSFETSHDPRLTVEPRPITSSTVGVTSDPGAVLY